MHIYPQMRPRHVPFILTALIWLIALPASHAELRDADCNWLLTTAPIVVKSPRPNPDIILEAGNLVITANKVYWRDQRVHLGKPGQPDSPIRRRLLMALVDRANSLAPFEELIEDVWPESLDDSEGRDWLHHLQVQVTLLRQEFRAVDPEFAAVVSVEKAGLGWVEDFTELPYQSIHEVELNADFRLVKWKGQSLQLAAVPFTILQSLIEAYPHPVSTQKLIDATLKYSFDPLVPPSFEKQRNVLSVQIKRLRQAFTTIDPDFRSIQTIPHAYSWSAFSTEPGN